MCEQLREFVQSVSFVFLSVTLTFSEPLRSLPDLRLSACVRNPAAGQPNGTHTHTPRHARTEPTRLTGPRPDHSSVMHNPAGSPGRQTSEEPKEKGLTTARGESRGGERNQNRQSVRKRASWREKEWGESLGKRRRKEKREEEEEPK